MLLKGALCMGKCSALWQLQLAYRSAVSAPHNDMKAVARFLASIALPGFIACNLLHMTGCYQ